MFNIDEILDEIIKKEGGYVNHPDDRGGPTNLGITLVTAKSCFGPSYTKESLKELTKEQAKKIYKKAFYMDTGFNLLPKHIQPSVIDAGVLSGPRRAIRILQETINTFKLGRLVVDGILGPLTYREARSMDQLWGPWLINNYADIRILYYIRIVVNAPNQLVFLKGWVNRALAFKTYR